MKKVAILYASENGVSYHRLQSWAHWMNAIDKIDLTIIHGGLDPEQAEKLEVDTLIFNRAFDPVSTMKETISVLQRKGIKVICDVDDYWHLHPGHQLEIDYLKNKRHQPIELAITEANQVWTTHVHLARKIRKLNRNVLIVPNSLNPNENQWRRTNVPQSFGWMGSTAHAMDLKTVLRPMKKYWQDDSLKWGMIMAGFHPNAVGIWLELQYYLTGGKLAPQDRYIRMEGKPVAEYGNLIDAIGVGIIPLADNEFNRCKSELKVLEFAAKGRTVIVQNIHPYTNICNEENSYLVNEPMDFYRHMKRIEKRPEEAAKKAEVLHQQCGDLYNWDLICNLRLENL